MKITVVDIDNKKLFNGAKVKNRRGETKEIFVLPEGMTISEAVKEGLFKEHHVEYETVMLNKHLFTLVEEEI